MSIFKLIVEEKCNMIIEYPFDFDAKNKIHNIFNSFISKKRT